MEAANSAILLNSAAQISRAEKAWRRCKVVGLDTEFVRERTYYANLGLVQVSDGHTVWLVDPLVEGAQGPIKSLLENPEITKIFHSPSEDFEVLQYAIGAVPEPMIDTQTACALLGQPLQMGYHAAAKWLLDVDIDKDQTRSNWCARPLKHEQLRYAALDVCLLPMMWEILRARLEDQGRYEWVLEDCARQLAKARAPVDPLASWQRIRGHGRLDGQSLAVLQALAEWRESQAEKRNLPRGFIVPDLVLLNVARNKLRTIAGLEELDDLHPRARKRHGPKMVGIVEQVLGSGRSLPVIKPLRNSERKKMAKLKDRIRSRASGLGIEPTVLASNRELEVLIQSNGADWPERLLGWRKSEIGEELVHMLEASR